MEYLLTYEDAMEMVKEYDNFNFSYTEKEVNGYKCVSFKYFLCDFNHFMKPLPKKPSVNALDMRGSTFVFNKDGSLYKRFLMLPKFFNLDQVEATQYHLFKDAKVSTIIEKLDGSMIGFYETPDGQIHPKTIGAFENEQIDAAKAIIFESEDKYKWIKDTIENGFTPLFEYISFDNRIVLKYSTKEIRFLGVRDNLNGSFLSVANFDGLSEILPFNSAKEEKLDTLDNLIERAKVEEDIEGWVITFNDGRMIKLKTQWYFNLHGIRTENIFREDFVIKHYLEETLDDITCQLDDKDDVDAFKFIDRVKLAVNNYIKFLDATVEGLVTIYREEYLSEWHYFAKFNHKAMFFNLAVVACLEPARYDKKKIEFIIKKNYKLKSAQTFVDKWAEDDGKNIKKWRG